MKLIAYIPDSLWSKIEPLIEADSWSNPEEDLFIFRNPSERFRTFLVLYDCLCYVEHK